MWRKKIGCDHEERGGADDLSGYYRVVRDSHVVDEPDQLPPGREEVVGAPGAWSGVGFKGVMAHRPVSEHPELERVGTVTGAGGARRAVGSRPWPRAR
ncbi:hypothetical protein [Saccharothrix sp. HUAS TT1]|uniref:hypothetical protein n=1 Tax=unclassified Saccharothrix TaxID=2593673 RepID=UPI00345BBD33